jgi:hypothetical protein
MKGLPWWALILLMSLLCLKAYGQGFSPVDARVSSVSGAVMFSSGAGQPAITASRGLALSPGNVIDTTGGGRAVVALTDGSIVIVQPGSIVTFKDFQQAGSLRELFEIAIGQVRVKINHFAGKPNPYRMNSPTASIAVRGTEFSITVDATGATRVVVYEGEVEVTSLSDPSHRTLIESGQGVLVAPGFDFQLFTPTAGDLARAGERDHDQQTPRAQAGTYERYIAGLESLNGLPLLLRYNAIPEAYLDSAENPAYATGFQKPEARLYILPSLGIPPESLENPLGTESNNLPTDFAVSSELSAFVPFDKGKFVFGGSATGSYFNEATGSSAGGLVDPGDLGAIPSVDAAVSSGKSTSRFFDGSLLLASRFGNNSFGMQAETLRGNGSLTSTTPDPDTPGQTLQDSLIRSDILQTRLTLGFKREIAARHTLGIFARYGFIDAKSQDAFNVLMGTPQPLTQTVSPGHTAEIGIRLRGEISRDLFYGVEAAWFGLSLRDAFATNGSSVSQQRDRENRESAGFGVGYRLGLRTTLVSDFAFGLSDIGAARAQDASGMLLQSGTAGSHFESLHLAVQREIGSRFFLIASFQNVWQGNKLSYSVSPANAGDMAPLADSLFSTSPSFYRSPGHLSDFGGGMRLSNDLLAQYIFSTDYGYSSSSHTLMLRYTFHFGKD